MKNHGYCEKFLAAITQPTKSRGFSLIFVTNSQDKYKSPTFE
jgi:hypothetical protein